MTSRLLPQHGATPAQVHRRQSDGLNLVVVEAKPVVELSLTLTPRDGESVDAMAERLAGALRPWNATVVWQTVLGATTACAPTLRALRQAVADPELPITWVEGSGCARHLVAGMQVHAVAGAPVGTIRHDGMVARLWDDARATHCVFTSILPEHTQTAPPDQASELFEKLAVGLAAAEMTMKDVARTWFYLDDILSWYGDFNRVRSEVFARNELRPHSFPASTGVGGRSPSGAALVASAWAVRPRDSATAVVRTVASPEQCPAPAYGSAFSRAVEIRSGGFRRLLLSGTASISPDGRTENIGDVRAQIDRSMHVAQAILESQRMSFADVSFATAFFRSPADAPLLADWLTRRGLQGMPMICAACDICRGDLLFEIELQAVQAGI